MPIVKVGPFLISRTGRSRQIVLLCHGGWSPSDGYVDVPPPMLVHFYGKHGDPNRGQRTAEAILTLGPEAYPGVIYTPGTPARPAGIPDNQWQNYLAQQAFAISQGQGCVYVFESVGGSAQKINTFNYGLCLIGPDGIVRPEEKTLLDNHDAGHYGAGDIDAMILKRNFTGNTDLKTAFKAAAKANGGRDYAVFHYAPCRWVEQKFMHVSSDLAVG